MQQQFKAVILQLIMQAAAPTQSPFDITEPPLAAAAHPLA